MPKPLALILALVALPAFADDEADAKKVAETYLNALTGKGDEAGKELLLGGVTMNAQLFTLDNWEIKSKELRTGEGDLGNAVAMMNDLDKAGRKALTKLMGAEAKGDDDLQVTELSPAEATKLLAPTKEKALAFQKAHKTLSYALRVGKEVYWHPKNPMRPLLSKAGGSGKYSILVYRWVVLSKEGPAKQPREWPLRVLRFKAGKLDTGWKVLPASDWNID
jgi:hypothetical protein